MANETVIGIDLGTTNCCVAAVVDGLPSVFSNKGGYRTTPSVFAVASSGRRLVGHIAKRQAVTNATSTVYASKRLIGRKWDSDERVKASETVAYTLTKGPHDDIRVSLGDQEFSLPEISAQLLMEMRQVAEREVGPVQKAVVTVPAYFNDHQRQATRDAGQIAGLEVIRIINEPTAAALAYGFGKDIDKRIAVFDLGGGTFDISILHIGAGVYDVMATSGDTYLGGEDFDERIIEWLVFNFAKEHRVDLREDKMALQRLKDAAEKAKCELSSALSTEINLPFIFSTGKKDALHLQCSLSRGRLEELVEDLVDRAIDTCEYTLNEAGLDRRDIDEVVLVGGQTRMPKVQQRVADFFKREPSRGVHPDEVVAIGAAIQANLLTHGDSDMLLLDVTPMSLGIMIAGGYFQVLIPKNTTVPTSASHTFTTVKDRQTQVKIIVLQGESEMAAENEMLGEFILTDLRDAMRGEVEIEVTFEISADGIVSVLARDLETGQQQTITVTATHDLSEEEIHDIADKNADYLVAAKASELFESLRTEIERRVRSLEALIPELRDQVGESGFGGDAVRKAEDIVEKARKAIEARDVASLDAINAALERTLNMFKGVLAKLSGPTPGA